MGLFIPGIIDQSFIRVEGILKKRVAANDPVYEGMPCGEKIEVFKKQSDISEWET